ncbi:class I tRNA ligase family protein [Candidatus Bathyarchaeota archaeon]|nr:class I tRNA ligase family protein [Candidatus Bathyarchaeota archaeon]
MAFYTIAKHIRQCGIKPEQLVREVFDYVFFGKGDLEMAVEKSGIASSILHEMRKEFLYWYPVDLRVSAKELVPNHLSFFIFQHVALFPREQWPKAIGVNGVLTIEGQKMSKSKGNFLTLRDAINRFSADVVRLTLALAAEEMNDPDWREENARSIDARLRALYLFIEQIAKMSGDEEVKSIDRWLISMLQGKIRAITEAIESLKTRTAAEIALYEVWNDIRWYIRRRDKPNPKILRDVANIWIRLLAPFAPFICEEMWSMLGNEGFVSLAEWPEYNESKVDVKAEETEAFIKNLISDTMNILRLMKTPPRRIYYYAAAQWKWKAYMKILEMAASKIIDMREAMKALIEDHELRSAAKNLAPFVSRLIEELNMLPKDRKNRLLKSGIIDEMTEINYAKTLLEKEFSAEVIVYSEEDQQKHDPRGKAQQARPYKPAIYVE